MQAATGRPFYRQRWWTPAFSVLLGLLMLGAFWLGGVAYLVAIFVLRSRS